MANKFTLDIAFNKQINSVLSTNAVDLSLDVIRNFLFKSKSNVVFVLDHNKTYTFSMLMGGMDPSEHDRIEYYNPADHLASVDVMRALSETINDHDGDALVVWAGLWDIHPMDLMPSIKCVSRLCANKFSVLIPVSTKRIPRSVMFNAKIYQPGDTNVEIPDVKDDENHEEAGSKQHG